MGDKTADNAGVLTIPPLIYLVGFLLGILFHYYYPIKLLSESIKLWVAFPLILMSIPTVLMAVMHLKKAETSIDVRTPTTTVVTSGIYRFSRNPMYLALLLLYSGIGCWINSFWILIMLVPVIILVNLGIIKREEKYLEYKFGEEYLKYKATVRRWI